MAVRGRYGGSRLRYIKGPSLDELYEKIEMLSYKVEAFDTTFTGTNWYVHYYIPKDVEAPLPVNKVVAKETSTMPVVKKKTKKVRSK